MCLFVDKNFKFHLFRPFLIVRHIDSTIDNRKKNGFEYLIDDMHFSSNDIIFTECIANMENGETFYSQKCDKGIPFVFAQDAFTFFFVYYINLWMCEFLD